MGVEESKALERKPTKSKIGQTDKSAFAEEVQDFITQLSTLACIRSTTQSTFEYVAFQKLPFTGHYAALPLCSTISNNYSSVFICYDCSTDEHAYLCQACFEKGNHDSHRFSVFPNNNGWGMLFCRCGDGEYMKKKTICETHNQVPKVGAQAIDKKDIAKFTAFFDETFKVLFSLMEKGRENALQSAIFSYLHKITDGNLYYSKIVCQFLLQKNASEGESSNLKKFVQLAQLSNLSWSRVFRNLNFATEYKVPILREMISGANSSKHQCSNEFFELILNFAGKAEYLNALAKDENLIIGLKSSEQDYSDIPQFYNLLIKTGWETTEIWKCLVKSKLIKHFVGNLEIIHKVIINLMGDLDSISEILGQLLEEFDSRELLQKYIIGCLMIQSPQFFIPGTQNPTPLKKTKTSSSKTPQKLDQQFNKYFSKLFFELNTHSQSENIPSSLLLLLPFFSFGEGMINKFWDQVEKRVEVITKNKEKKVIKEASMNVFQLITALLRDFMTWDHKVLRDASEIGLKEYTKDTKLVEKVLVQYFDKKPKVPRVQLLQNVDAYTQKQRSLAKTVMKVNLRYNPRKGKYYNISKKLPNNSYNFEDLNIGSPLKFTEWQEFVSKKFFTESFYRLVPALIKVAQKALMEDIQMVELVSNITASICLLNKSIRKNMKEVTRNFIKEIPDVQESIYYVLARIRDRLELDIDDAEESGRKGTKKPKLDLITEIRDKKFREIKLRQEKMRLKWLKEAEALDSDHEVQGLDNICNICKEKQTDKRRFVYPCNFSRNNVISTMLRSEVTDLDINICLHKVHEDCFQKERRKGCCPVCKFEINCYVPEKPLADQSYTKNWLRNFENIITTINLQSGKSFNSDWATIFLTYLIYSKGLKVLLKSSEIRNRQREKTDELILLHYKSQLEKWPELTKQAIKRAEKTVKAAVTRESNVKKVIKTLVFDLVIQEVTGEPFKNVKRVEKKFRELINAIGTENAQKINERFAWSRDSESIKEIFSSNVSDQVQDLFKIRELPEKASEYLAKTSIKCPMCNRYQPTTWQCLFCEKISCQNCMNPRNHCESNHKGSGIILHLSDAKYELYHDSRQVEMDSLYRNEYEEGWQRDLNPEGWQAHTNEIYTFFDTILHSHSPFKKKDPTEDDSDNEGQANRGWGQQGGWGQPQAGGFGFGNRQNDLVQDEDDDGHGDEDQGNQGQGESREEPQSKQEEDAEDDGEDGEGDEDEDEEDRPPRRAPRPTRPARKSMPAKKAAKRRG